jgi:hypothetical protein
MRQPGPYWIKYHGREWEIAYWYGDFWIMFGLEDYPKKDDELDEIDENRIERTESDKPHWKQVADAIQSVFDKKRLLFHSQKPNATFSKSIP